MRVSIESWVIIRQEGNSCSLLGKKPSFIRHSRDVLVHTVSESLKPNIIFVKDVYFSYIYCIYTHLPLH